MADRDDYYDEVAVPFFPRKWLNKFTVLFVIIIAGIIFLKHWLGFFTSLPFSDTFLGDISVLITVIFSLAFVLGRWDSWKSRKDVKTGVNIGKNMGRNEVIIKFKDIYSNRSWTPQEKIERVGQVLEEYEDD